MSKIPGPKPLPILGTGYTINPKNITQSGVKLGEKYGSVYRHQLPGQPPKLMISSFDLVDELSNEERFHKLVHPAIDEVRAFGGNGLFTAYADDPDWHKAHRILMPAFNPAGLESMYNGMIDIAEQLVFKWARTRPDEAVDITEDFTRLTLDTIALTSFSYRFNSFYKEELHPFVQAMVDALGQAGKRAYLPDSLLKVDIRGRRRFDQDVKTMEETVDALIEERKRQGNSGEHNDVLDLMLTASDPKTGEKLSDENLRYQLVTFLIAGHETTSGTLSFTMYELMRNPDVFQKARDVVDDVLGRRFPEFEDLKKLSYLDQILRETLRKYPPVPGYAVTPYEDTTIGGREEGQEPIEVSKGDTLFILLPLLHRDPAIWVDPEEFDPDRFSYERAKDIPHNAWKPFGNGQRSCLGRAFALQEATMVLALLLQNFDFEFADPDYQFKLVDGLTWKPDNLRMHIKHRPGYSFAGRSNTVRRSAQLDIANSDYILDDGEDSPVESNGKCITLLVGSNAGTSQTFAKKLYSYAKSEGYKVRMHSLDEATGNIPSDGPVLICTSSYEGQPTDDAKRFVSWLEQENHDPGSLSDVSFAVFGSGNSEWASTFHKIPRYIDNRLAELGATRVSEAGFTDVRGDHFGDFDAWATGLWDDVAEYVGVTHLNPFVSERVDVTVLDNERAEFYNSTTGSSFVRGLVLSNEQLSTEADGPISVKYQIDLELPEGIAFTTGDYLDVLATNPHNLVQRAITAFGLEADTQIELGGQSSYLPLGSTLSAGELFYGYVELGAPAPRAALHRLAEECPCPPEADELRELSTEEGYAAEIQAKRMSLLDVLEKYTSVRLSVGDFISFLQPLTPRRYSISSASEVDPQRATLTYSRPVGPAWSGAGEFEATASTFLSRLQPGAAVTVDVVAGSEYFRPPQEPTSRMVMIAAGTGIAPFRAFLEHSEASGANTTHMLYYGCHGPDSDFLYRDQLAEWEKKGIVQVIPVYSRHAEDGVRYVQDMLWQCREDIVEYVREGATFYLCGEADGLAPDVRRTFHEIFSAELGDNPEEAENRLAVMERDHHFLIDVFD